MTRGQARECRRRAWDAFVTAWGVAVIPNALVASGLDLDGPWLILRYLLSVAFVVALVFLIVAFVRERLTPPEAST